MVHKILNLLLLVTIALITSCSSNSGELRRKAVRGSIDLRNWDFEHQSELEIGGEFEFYWEPTFPISQSPPDSLPREYVEVTTPWEKQKGQYKTYPREGYAMYRLQILLPNSFNRELAIEITEKSAATALYVNGEYLSNNGIFSIENRTNSLGVRPHIARIKQTVTDTLIIDIWACNFGLLKTGLGKPLHFGLANRLENKWHVKLSISLFLMGSILMMAFYHLGLFFLRNEDKSSLYFGLFAFFIGVRVLFNGGFFINEFITLPEWLIKKIDYTFFYLSLGMLISFLNNLFPHEFPKWIKTLALSVSISFAIFVYATPFRISQYSLLPFQLFTLSLGIWSIFALYFATARRRQSAAVFLIGFVVLFITSTNDILFSMGVIDTAHIVPFGLFIFIFAQAFLLSARFTDAYRSAQQLSMALDNSNRELETRVQQRTISLQQANVELEKLSMVANKTDNGVIIMDANGNVEWINKGFTQLTGYTLQDLSQTYGLNITDFSTQKNIRDLISSCITNKQTTIYDALTVKKDGTDIWLHTTLTPIFDDQNQIVKLIAVDTDITKLKLAESEIQQQKAEIEQQRDQVTMHRDEIENKNKRITDSLLYARNIQRAIMPSEQQLRDICRDAFVLNLPKDIVSGDFYWIAERGQQLIIAVADCTGHGVPGAFMSSLGITFLNEIVNEAELPSAGQILTKLRHKVKSALRQNSDTINKRDGIDMALCSINRETQMAQFAGAYNPLWIIRNKELTIYRGDRMPVGNYHKDNADFTNQEIQLLQGDRLYMFTDGYIDQFYQGQLVKLNTKRFKRLILEMHDLPFAQQKESLLNAFNLWKGSSFIQVDDILILGFEM